MGDIEDMAKLAEFAKKLHVYFTTASMGISFLVFGSIFGAYWLLIYSIASIYHKNWIYIGGALGTIPLALLCAFLVDKTVPGIKREEIPNEGARWIVSFIIPMTLASSLSSLYPQVAFLWYGALGLSSLLAHLLIERPLISRGFLMTRSLLIASVSILLTFPPLFLLPPYLASAIALGLCLLFFSISGTYALARASKLFSGE